MSEFAMISHCIAFANIVNSCYNAGGGARMRVGKKAFHRQRNCLETNSVATKIRFVISKLVVDELYIHDNNHG